MNDKHIFFIPTTILLAMTAAILTGCSTTSNLPEGEQLYVGIEDINYTDAPGTKNKNKADSAGVITSIGEAVKSVNEILQGYGAAGLSASDTLGASSREAKRQQKIMDEIESANFETTKAEVDAVLAYPPNNSLFGSSKLKSPLQIGLWIHNSMAGKQGKFPRWIYRTFGTTPVLVSSVSPEMRAKVATNTLHNYGYFKGTVDYQTLTQKNPRKAKISYSIKAGQLYRLDSIAYMYFPPVADSLLKATHDKRLLKKGDAFSVVNLSGEQTRIENLLRENGYYYYSAPYTIFRADTLMRKNHVQLQVRPADDIPAKVNRPWYIGNTFVSVRNKADEPLDSILRRRNFTFAFPKGKMPLKPFMWRRAISHRRGDLYSLTDQKSTIEKLNAIGVFSQMDINYIPRDSSENCDTLDLYVSATMDKLYDSSFEMNATMKSNQQVGPGVSFGLAKRNAFRGGEKVSFNINGSYEWQTGAGAGGRSSLVNSYELGTSLDFEFPRLVIPHFGKRRLRLPSSTTFSLDADWKNRAGFFNMFSTGLSATYKWSRYKSSQHELTLLSLDFDKLIHTSASFDSIMSANSALYISMRDQFVPSLSYTFTYASSSEHRNPVWVQLGIKEAGNLSSAIFAAAGRKFNEAGKRLFGNPFAQFVKVTAEVHNTTRVTRDISVVSRLFGGIVYSYGNSSQAPYSDQFYVGGANSVRAFTVRTVGPGSFRSDNSRYAYIDQTGDIKLEANIELRAKLFGDLHGAAFVDAGNVWLLRDDPQRPGGKFSLDNLKKIAVGTGLGLRYDLQFLVLRFDVGVALHAPYETGKSGWYNIPKFGKGLAYHFAIGYPF